MQRVKPRRARQHSDEEFIEDVSDTSSTTSAQPLITKPTEVFSAQAQEETVPLRSEEAVEDENQMVTIVNSSVPESKLASKEDLLQISAYDHPISLVYANNENPFVEDITTPISPASLVSGLDPIKAKQEEGSRGVVKVDESASEEDEKTPENDYVVDQPQKPRDNTSQSENGEVENLNVSEEAESEHQDEAKEPNPNDTTEIDAADWEQLVEYANDANDPEYHEPEPVPSTAGYQEIPQQEQVEEKRVPHNIDEFGTLLYNEVDGEGNPILDYNNFPEDWVRQPDQGDGIVRFETNDGQVRFIMELGYNYPDPPNIYELEMDCHLKHIPTTHRTAAGCEFFVDNGIWRLQLETDVVNILRRMDIATDFEDVTGEKLWNINKDVTIENLTKAVSIFKDCTLDDSPIRWTLANDAVYNPRDSSYKLSDGYTIENITRNVSIADGMTMVESKTHVSIPNASTTEFRDHSHFAIYSDSEMVDQGTRHLDSGGCEVLESASQFVMVEDSKLEDQGTRHLQTDEAILEDQGTRHLLCEEGEKVDIVREHRHAEDASLVDISHSFQLFDDGDKVDIKRHYLTMDQNIDRTPANWTLAEFDGEVVDLVELRLETDMKYEVSPSKFNLNQLDLDDDFLDEIEDEEEE